MAEGANEGSARYGTEFAILKGVKGRRKNVEKGAACYRRIIGRGAGARQQRP